MKTYLVAYSIKQTIKTHPEPEEMVTDHYRVFTEENTKGESPKKQAEDFYKYLLDEYTFKGNKELYAAHICKIIKSTD